MTVRPTNVDYELFGAYEGKNVTHGGVVFRNGIGRALLSSENVPHLDNYLGYYGGLRIGTEAHSKAVTERNTRDGISSEAEANETKRTSGKISGVHGKGVQGTADPSTGNGAGTTDPATGKVKLVSDGIGRKNPGVLSGTANDNPAQKAMTDKIFAVVKSLDPAVDDLWTEEGVPRLDAVQGVDGLSGVTRQDVEAACPGFDREAAFEESLAT